MIYFTELNPLKFVKRQVVGTVDYDYITKFPNPDSFKTDQAYKGIFALQYYQRFIKDVAIDFQLQYNSSDAVTVYAWLNNVRSAALTRTDITPVDWDGVTNKVYKYSYTPAATGCLWFEVQDGTTTTIYYDSWQLGIEDSLQGYRQLHFVNNDSSLGAVFWDKSGATSVFEGLIYLEIYMKPILSGELETYKDDRGSPQTLRPTPEDAYELQIKKVPDQFIKKLELILSCTNLEINGIRYSPFEKAESEPVSEFTNNNNVTVTVGRVNWNYMQDDDGQGETLMVEQDGTKMVLQTGEKMRKA